MRDLFAVPRYRVVLPIATRCGRAVLLTGLFLALPLLSPAAAESHRSELVILPPSNSRSVPTKIERPTPQASTRKPTVKGSAAVRGNPRASRNRPVRTSLRQINAPTPPDAPVPSKKLDAELEKNPCAAMDEKPLGTLGIGIAQPAGTLPKDYATACWNELNATAGPFAAMRCWSSFAYNWNATCLCYRPLYFEQINLERYGYGCCESLQPLASAAHFFATIPALPYCMAVECPCECVYALGHYRPGSCPPWRHHWPPCSPLAAVAEGGVWTGMVFLIP